MANPIVRAFNLALNGNSDIAAMLSSGQVSANDCRPDGMYKSWSFLHAAASKGHNELVACLLDAGADATMKTDQGKTAADLAQAKGHTAVHERLLEAMETPSKNNAAPGTAAPGGVAAAPADPAAHGDRLAAGDRHCAGMRLGAA